MKFIRKYLRGLFQSQRVKRIPGVSAALAAVLLLLPLLTGTVFAGLSLQEMTLSAGGRFENIHADLQGNLWLADQANHELWRLNAAGNEYTVYHVGEYPFSAVPDSAGRIWWLSNKTFNSMNIEGAATQKWDISSYVSPDSGLVGMAVDGSDRVWITDSGAASAHRYNPSNNQFCSYALPANTISTYPDAAGNRVWFGDRGNGRLVRIDSSDNTVTWWQLPAGSHPQEVAMDATGNAWYTDFDLAQIGRLDPSTHGLRIYTLPAGTKPYALAAAGGKIWYTEQNLASTGKLNPGTAAYTSSQLTPTSNTVAPSCSPLGPPTSGTAGIRTGTQAWAPATYPSLVNTGGWSIYQMPAGAKPYGIAVTDYVYLVDFNRVLVARVSLQPQVAACKLKDNDGNPGTTADQTPLAGWTLYLSVNSARQLPGKTTGADGCSVWPNLAAGPTYGVEEDPGTDWVALAGTIYSFGPAQPGEDYQHTFINSPKPTLTLVNTVVNDNGGLKGVADFPLFISSSPAASGTPVRLEAGSYTASETQQGGYTASAWGGDCAANGLVTLALGENKTCTITNNDNAPALHLRKEVVNDNGGSALAADWTLSAAGPTPFSGHAPVDSGASFDQGDYSLSESGPAGYSAGPWSCEKNGGPAVQGSSINLALGDVATCTISSDDNAPALHLRKVVVNGGGGTAQDTDWTLSAAGPTPFSGHTPVDSGASFYRGTYTLTESGPAGYAASAWSCIGGTQNGNLITLGLGQSATCTITNTYIPPEKPYKAYLPAVRQ